MPRIDGGSHAFDGDVIPDGAMQRREGIEFIGVVRGAPGENRYVMSLRESLRHLRRHPRGCGSIGRIVFVQQQDVHDVVVLRSRKGPVDRSGFSYSSNLRSNSTDSRCARLALAQTPQSLSSPEQNSRLPTHPFACAESSPSLPRGGIRWVHCR